MCFGQVGVLAYHDDGTRPEILVFITRMGEQTGSHFICLANVDQITTGMLWIGADQHIDSRALEFPSADQLWQFRPRCNENLASPVDYLCDEGPGRIALGQENADRLTDHLPLSSASRRSGRVPAKFIVDPPRHLALDELP